MLKLSKKQYKILLKDMLSSTYPNTVKVHIDFDNELIYFLNPETDMIWYLEGDLTTVLVNQSWSLLPKAMLKQANKVILADKHYIVVEPLEEEIVGDTDGDVTELKFKYKPIEGVPLPTENLWTDREPANYAKEVMAAYGGAENNNFVFQQKPEYEQPKQAVCALIVRSSPYGLTFLGVSRKNNPRDFGLPGGKVEHRESLYEALYREVLEETGYTITDTALEVFRNTDQDGYEVITLIAKIDRTVERKALAPNETGVVTWVSATELMQGSFGEYNKQLFESLGYPYASS